MGERPCAGPSSADARGLALGRLILDTTVLITAERRDPGLEVAIDDEDDIAIAAITAAELLVGIELATPKYRERRKRFVEGVLAGVTVEDYDLRVARVHAELLAHARSTGRQRSPHDLIIAATAASTERAVITTDDAGFEDLPGVVVHPV